MNAFQLRLELLKMAQALLMEEYSYKRNASEQQWRTQVDAAQVAGTTSPDYPALPPFPTEADIVKKAESLNLFVSQTTPQLEIKPTKKTS